MFGFTYSYMQQLRSICSKLFSSMLSNHDNLPSPTACTYDNIMKAYNLQEKWQQTEMVFITSKVVLK